MSDDFPRVNIRDILGQSMPRTVLRALFTPACTLAVLRCFATAAWYFFGTQFRAHLFPHTVRKVAVDHPLDEKIPFSPERVDVYLEFTNLWILTLGHALRRFGWRNGRTCAEFIHGIADCYVHAYGVYRRCVSTTRRPDTVANDRFKMIYRVDPHLYCVPSLHIMIVVAAYKGAWRMFARAGREAEGRYLASVVREHSLAIADSVLYVKQHSINCIPAALYMMASIFPDCPPAEVREFLDSMLRDPELAADRPALMERMHALLEQFLEEGKSERDYREPVVRFLNSYPDVRHLRNPYAIAVDGLPVEG